MSTFSKTGTDVQSDPSGAVVPTKPVCFNGTVGTSTTFGATTVRGSFLVVPYRVTVSRIRLGVITSSGNISAALYAADGQTRLATTGAIACPAAGNKWVTFTQPVTLDPGTYFVAVSFDNATASFQAVQNAQIIGGTLLAATHPCPATMTVDNETGGTVPALALG